VPGRPTILIAEDDADLRRLLVRGLAEEGFEATAVRTGAELLQATVAAPPDALIVDIGLPDSDGRDLCQAIRAEGIGSPVLFLTARDALSDRLAGFSAGGDDYVTKPFALEEVIARLRALMRRASVDGAIEAGSLRLDPVTHAASAGGQAVVLTPTEFRLLAGLASRPQEVLRRRELIDCAWPYGAIVHDNTLDAYVARLRRKLRSLPGAPEIATVRGVGYSLG
jgi:two-component system response regulator MprA